MRIQKSHFYLVFALIFSTALCAYNFFNGFAEDSDSIRLIHSAELTKELNRLVPSRSWGFPLYEASLYALINSFSNGILLGKLLSFFFLILTLIVVYSVLIRLQLSAKTSCLLCMVFSANPLVIIAGNSILETSMSLFFLMLTVFFFVNFICEKVLSLRTYIVYGVLFGIANLVRPDNMIYFPSLFIFLFLGRKLNYKLTAISIVAFLLVGVLPYFLIQYPIFHALPSGSGNRFLFVIKNLLAIFGLPLFFFVIVTVIKFFSALKQSIKWQNEVLQYLLIIVPLVLFRMLLLPDELEYGIFIWVAFVFLIGISLTQIKLYYPKFSASFFLSGLLFVSFLPNIVQVYFFKEKNFEYIHSIGVTRGVLQQEKERRLYNLAVLDKGTEFLMEVSDSLRKRQVPYSTSIVFKECDSCIVLTSVRDLKIKKAAGGTGTNQLRQRFVFSLDFNVSRGWRNFIKDNRMPPLSAKHLVISY